MTSAASALGLDTSLAVSIILLLALLIPIYGLDVKTAVTFENEYDRTNPLCRTVRNARNTLLTKSPQFLPANPDFVSVCVISNSCTSLFCSINPREPSEGYGWNLRLCDSSGSTIKFLLNSSSVTKSKWSTIVSPKAEPQRSKVPLDITDINGMDHYLNVTFRRWFSSGHGTDETWSQLSLDISVDICRNETCNSTNILNGIQFPLRQLCDHTDSSPPSNLIKTKEAQVQIHTPISSHMGMSCTLDNPFKCGINSVCRRHEGGKDNEGICDCCEGCVLALDGSCAMVSTTTTTEKPHDAHDTDNENSSTATRLGTFFAIVCLILLGGGIFYGVKYSVFSRLNNRLRLYWASHCRSRRVISVSADQGNMFNPLYDDDEPPLL